ncbi:MAG: peptidoglycan-N-acetylglucosamine deacetylase [Blastocatellia bacterium]|jgi:peptidoglycan/xylan/chitin deacetylase (PgdA/CDA1 family)|nr:peptidoglycan-N-acetylglucosamine deacetylase [Blastocatellia bacterium]
MLDAVPIIAGTVCASAGAAGVYYAAYAVRSQWLGPTVWRGRAETGAVSLTFDDGPSADTERVLDVLDAHNLRAAFFMVGHQVERYPQTARRVAACGHEIGNHSYSHPIYLYRGARETWRQLAHTQQVIADVTGVRARFARPPCGVRTLSYFRAARVLGLQTVQWTLAGFDWKKRTPSQIARDVLRRAEAGSIILLHDGDSENRHDRSATVAALPLIIEGLNEKGIHIVPLSDLIEGSENR